MLLQPKFYDPEDSDDDEEEEEEHMNHDPDWVRTPLMAKKPEKPKRRRTDLFKQPNKVRTSLGFCKSLEI